MAHDECENPVFENEVSYKIGAVTYHVAAYFDEAQESIFPKIRRLLSREVESELLQLGRNEYHTIE